MIEQRKCEWCGKDISETRKDAKVCSNRCYMAKWRGANPGKREEARAYMRDYSAKNPEKHKAWLAANPEKVRANGRDWRANNREEHRASIRAWRTANPEKVRSRATEWQKSNPERVKLHRRRKQLKISGITPEIFDQWLENQKSKCPISGAPFTASGGFRAIPHHNHNTGHPESLWCQYVNWAEGHISKTPDPILTCKRLLKYFEESVLFHKNGRAA